MFRFLLVEWGGNTERINIKTFIPLMLILLAFFFCISTVSAAKEIYVNTTGNDTTGTGTADNPYLTIKKGVDNVEPNGVIKIADGEYYGVNNTRITLNKNIKIIGQSRIKTIVNGKGTNWIFKIQPGVNIKLYYLKIINGYTSVSGGAIQNYGILTIERCQIENNTAHQYGGAIHNYCSFNENNSDFNTCVLNINYCILKGNSAHLNGGAISNQCIINVKNHNFGACVLNINNCIITKNHAGKNGGAISNQGRVYIDGFGLSACVLNLNNCIINKNTANNDGGAISNQGRVYIDGSGLGACVLNLNKCNLSNNIARRNGGAILNHSTVYINVSGSTKTSLNVDESCFTGNKAGRYGGAISNIGTAKVIFNRFFSNYAYLGSAIRTYNTINASDNWWGSNYPDFKSLISTSAKAKVIYSPWLYLTFTATPNIISVGSASILKASFNHHTNGTTITPINPVNGHIPDGTPVIFSTTLGNVGSKSVLKYTILGTANAILRGDEGSGVAYVSLIADGQKLNADVIITDPNAAVADNIQTVQMQETGFPITGIALAILMVIGGFISTKKK